MSSYTAPSLVTTIDAAGYRTEIDSNFSLIQQALRDIQNALPSFGGRVTAANLTWVESALRPDGIIGILAFTPQFATDEDVVTIAHNAPDGISACVIEGRYHESRASYSWSFTDVVTSDGTYEVVLGARSLGAPAMELLLELQETDRSSELVLYSMDVERSGSSFTVTNLRLEATVLLDRDAFRRCFAREEALCMTYQGALPQTGGAFGTGVVVPWDAEVTGARLSLTTAPTGATEVSIELRDRDDTDGENVLAETASWAPGEDRVVRELAGKAEPQQLEAGAFLRPWLTQPGDGVAADLSVTVLLRRVYHEIRA